MKVRKGVLVLARLFENSLIFNGVELGKFGVIEKIDRPFLTPMNIIEKDINGRDGVLYKDSPFKPLNITISIRLYNRVRRNIDDMIFDLMQMIYSKKLCPLNYRRNRVWYDAILVGVDSYKKFRNERAYMDLEFKVPSGLGRSEYKNDYYKNFTSKEISLNSVLPTKGIFTFNGSSNKITNMRTGEFIEILSGTSQNFVIDCEKEIVTFEENRAMDRVSPYSDFFEIRNGDVIKASNPISLEFYERYLYDR